MKTLGELLENLKEVSELNFDAGYIYKITNKINGKWYIGSRRGYITVREVLEDKYLGSGFGLWRAIKKYGIENFEKKVLCISENAYLTEECVLTYLNAAADKCSYNMVNSANPPLHKGEEHPMKRSEMRQRMKDYWHRNINNIVAGRQRYRDLHGEWMQTPKGKAFMRERNNEWFKSGMKSKVVSAQIINSSGSIKHPRAIPLKCIESGEMFPNRECAMLRLGVNGSNLKRHLDLGKDLSCGLHLIRISRQEYYEASDEIKFDFHRLTSMTISSQASQECEEGSTTISKESTPKQVEAPSSIR